MGFYYVICMSLGPAGWVVIGEIFPTKIRGRAASLATALNRGSSAMCAFCFLTISNAITPAGLFILLSVINVGSAYFMYRFLPETKGKSLEEIEREFEVA